MDLENGGSAPGGNADGLTSVGGLGDVLPGSRGGVVADDDEGDGEEL